MHGYLLADWYRRVRPWYFEIHDVIRQRGEVSILNNVINPTRRGRIVARGIYFVKVVGPGINEIRKVMVVK
ncbi:hypothetical protein ES703_38774 [subsurface metagenome]